jgi:hypothetical protein
MLQKQAANVFKVNEQKERTGFKLLISAPRKKEGEVPAYRHPLRCG